MNKKTITRHIPKPIKRGLRRIYASALYALTVSWRRGRAPMILSPEDTLRRIIDGRLSVCRYGDGELNIIRGVGNGFCTPNCSLAHRLDDILTGADDLGGRVLVCIPGALRTLRDNNSESRYFWHLHLSKTFSDWLRHARRPLYGDTLVTRFYIDYLDRARTARMVDLWKEVWQGRDLLIVEGYGSRLGVGNDLFDNAASVKRILCPPKNAYESYDTILETTLRHAGDRLVIIALGQTATVLAYDLAAKGLQALDLGHIDVEYEWYRMGVTEKTAIPSKAVNEVSGIEFGDVDDPDYKSQIIAKI